MRVKACILGIGMVLGIWLLLTVTAGHGDGPPRGKPASLIREFCERFRLQPSPSIRQYIADEYGEEVLKRFDAEVDDLRLTEGCSWSGSRTIATYKSAAFKRKVFVDRMGYARNYDPDKG